MLYKKVILNVHIKIFQPQNLNYAPELAVWFLLLAVRRNIPHLAVFAWLTMSALSAEVKKLSPESNSFNVLASIYFYNTGLFLRAHNSSGLEGTWPLLYGMDG